MSQIDDIRTVPAASVGPVPSAAAAPVPAAHVVAREKKAVLVGVHCSQRLIDAVDRFMADQPDEMSRPQAFRTIMAKWLRAEGYL